MNKKVLRGSLSLALATTLVVGASPSAMSAEIEWGSDNSGIITLDTDVTGITFGNGTAPDKDTEYQEAKEYQGNLSNKDKERLITALMIGQSISDGSFDIHAGKFLGGNLVISPGVVKDPLSESISDMISSVLVENGQRSEDPTVTAILDQLEGITLGNRDELAKDVKILVAEPKDESYRDLMVLSGSGVPSLSDIAKTIGGDIQLRTSAGSDSDNKLVEGNTITDVVRYTGLIPGQEYRIVGEAVALDKDGKATETGDNTGEKKFTPRSPEGEVEVTISLDKVTSDSIVVFETLYDWNNKVIAEHKDPSDKAQTIKAERQPSSIKTSADSNTGDYIQTGTVINDTVTYTGLTPGKEYRLEARLMCKKDEQPTQASATHVFTPTETNGSTKVEGIQVTDQDCLEQVVYEKLYDNTSNTLIAAHEDINDKAQTIGSPDALMKKKDTSKKTPSPSPDSGKSASPTPETAPRQVIDDMPSGYSTSIGSTLFTR